MTLNGQPQAPAPQEQGTTTEVPAASQPTPNQIIKSLRMSDPEWLQMLDLIRLACNMGHMGIDRNECPKQCSVCMLPTFSSWVKFSTLCAETVLKQAVLQSKGFS